MCLSLRLLLVCWWLCFVDVIGGCLLFVLFGLVVCLVFVCLLFCFVCCSVLLFGFVCFFWCFRCLTGVWLFVMGWFVRVFCVSW